MARYHLAYRDCFLAKDRCSMKVFWIACVAVALGLAGHAARASVVEDQFYDDLTRANTSGEITNNYDGESLWAGQTFEAGLTGTLSSIQFYASNHLDGNTYTCCLMPEIMVEIWTGMGVDNVLGMPVHTGLTMLGEVTESVPSLAPSNYELPFDFGGFIDVDLSRLAIPITSGTEYSFEVYALGNGDPVSCGRPDCNNLSFDMAGTAINNELTYAYPRGIAYGTQNGLGNDVFFRTFVDVPNSVPEPSTLVLLATGLVIAGMGYWLSIQGGQPSAVRIHLK